MREICIALTIGVLVALFQWRATILPAVERFARVGPIGFAVQASPDQRSILHPLNSPL